MRLYRNICGTDERYAVAENEKEAYDQRESVDPTFRFLAVRIEEVTVPGYTLTLTPIKGAQGDDIDAWDKQRCKEHLDSKGVEYVPQWGVEKLREAVKANK